MAGRARVVCLAGAQVQARLDKVQLNVPAVLVLHPKHVVFVAAQAGEVQALNVGHDLALLGLGRRVRSLERNHA